MRDRGAEHEHPCGVRAEPTGDAPTRQWLVICVDPEIRQLILLDAPSVLGWEGFRDVTQRYSLGMAEQLLIEAMNEDSYTQPTRPLAHTLIGALDEAAMLIATADDREQTRADVHHVLRRLLDAMLTEA